MTNDEVKAVLALVGFRVTDEGNATRVWTMKRGDFESLTCFRSSISPFTYTASSTDFYHNYTRDYIGIVLEKL